MLADARHFPFARPGSARKLLGMEGWWRSDPRSVDRSSFAAGLRHHRPHTGLFANRTTRSVIAPITLYVGKALVLRPEDDQVGVRVGGEADRLLGGVAGSDDVGVAAAWADVWVDPGGEFALRCARRVGVVVTYSTASPAFIRPSLSWAVVGFADALV